MECSSGVFRLLTAMYIHVFLFMLLGTNWRVSAQTTSINPAFTNIAPCGCDLTENQLDNDCCCDEEYNATTYGNVFNCIQGPYGGDFTTQNDEFCTEVLSFTPDWFPLLCIQTLNSPSLGLYFYPSATTGSASWISYDRTVSSFTTSTTSSLQSGSTLDTQYTSLHDSVLRFPQVSAGGNCARQSPVHYLHDTLASCDATVDASSCTSNTVLDAEFYTSMTSVANQIPKVSYLCASTNDAAYVKRNTGIGGAEADSAISSCVSGYQAPTVSGDTCQNAVAGVSYTFTWSAGNISQFDIVVTLVNMSFTSLASLATSSGPDYVLTQQFSVNFVVSATNQISYSGFPGYEFGLPVISGNGSSNASIPVDRTIQLLVWQTGATGTCSDTTSPKFGFNEISGCLVDTVSECASLRANIEATQLQLLQANKVARFGNPEDTDIDADWVDIISSTSNQSYNDAIAGQCEGIPSRAVIEFLWTRSGDTNGTAIREIVSANVRFERETWTLRCNSAGSCDQRVIYSEVTFTEIPPQETTPQTSYEINKNDTCQKDATCWPELLLPLQPEFYYLYSTTVAFQLRSYNYAWAIFVTFFSVAAALIPAHWSTVGKYLKQVLPI